jgi:hypothetical protein
VISDGGAAVTARGVCWSTSQDPSISDNHTTNGSGTGSFTSDILGLTASTHYFVRAYATNSAGTSYGDTVGFTTTEAILLPTVTTAPITNIGQTIVTCGGNVTSEGSSAVTFRGVCWGTTPNPDISGNHTTDGYGTGSFISNITGLTAGTPYYVRAYAINNDGVAYGNEVSCTTALLQVPVVVTLSVFDYTPTTALGGGNITSDGGSMVTSRGVCWSTLINPAISDNHTNEGSGTGSFLSNMTGLTRKTPYFVRAYAINSVGTAYGDNQLFNSGGFPLLNVPGNYQGWIPADSSTVVSSLNSDNKYEGYIWFPENTEFKYARGSWAENWGDNYGDGHLEPNGANILAPLEGYYKLNADLNSLTHTFVSTTWSVIGSATPGGPNTDIDMSYDNNTRVWTVTIDLVAGEFKFRANHSWTINYGDNDSNLTLEQNGAGIVVSTPGVYTINLYLSLSIYRYTVIQN